LVYRANESKVVMHLVSTNFYGGPEKLILGHLECLRDARDNRYEGMLASYLERGNPNETLEKARMGGVKCFGISMSGPLDMRTLWTLKTLLCHERVDLLCTHGYKSTLMGWWTRQKAGIPVVAFSHGYTAENKKVALYEWLERQVLGRLDGVIFVSEGQRRRLESFGIRSRKSWIVRNAISVKYMRDEWLGPNKGNIVRRRLGVPEGAAVVVSVGRLSPEKGHRFLVEAIARMHGYEIDTHFVFCGDGPCQRELEIQCKRLGISNVCHFVGFRRDMGEIYQAMDLLVLPSLTEGLPTVILEAFAAAKPVVATAVGGVPEVVEDGVNGILVPPGRSDVLAEAIKECLAAPEKRGKMGEAGYHKVKSEFTFESLTEKFVSIYDEILKAPA
jgi:glycosyltransferase involved in cell wall biosynthesis